MFAAVVLLIRHKEIPFSKRRIAVLFLQTASKMSSKLHWVTLGDLEDDAAMYK